MAVPKELVTAGILGHAVGDALGVPVEFLFRDELKAAPVTGMRGEGTHGQPPGTWSDDTSLTLCLVESLCEVGIDHDDQARRFVRWMTEGQWTPHGRVFDIGNATREAILNLDRGAPPLDAGPTRESSNGNGSLMRILPLGIYLAYAEPLVRFGATTNAGRLTHGHPRSQLSCAFYAEVAAALIRREEMADAMRIAQETLRPMIARQPLSEQKVFSRLLSPGLSSLGEDQISGSGYVIHCLEASLWCALNAESYADGVLRAVNLGEDTDTTGAVTGGLLGLRFGLDSIPAKWRDALARQKDLEQLCKRFQDVCEAQWRIDGREPSQNA